MKMQAQLAGALAGLIGGVLTAALGTVFTIAGWLVFDAAVRHWLSAAGTALFYLTVPLLILAGYSLDWLENGKPHPRSNRAYREDDEGQQQ